MRAANFLMTVGVLAAASSGAASADISISSKPTANMSCDSGVCTATAQKAVLNVGDLQTMLASGDVTVKTGSVAKDIELKQPLSWTSTSRLTLDAQQSVSIEKQVTVSGTGNLTIVTNDGGGKKGEFIIVPEHGSVQFWDLGSSLIVGGNSYTLVGDIKTQAADIAANPSGFYALAKNYDASVDGTYSSSPIQTKFEGVFEGLGNVVANLLLNSTESGAAGFFSFVDSTGTVRDVSLLRMSVEVFGHLNFGLLAGDNLGLIERCVAIGKAKVNVGDLGGLVGGNNGTITDSYADANFSGEAELAGGLVGYNQGGAIAYSFARGSITIRNGEFASLGGLVGDNSGAVENSFSVAHVKAGVQNDNSNFGGLVGTNETNGRIGSSYAAGEITIKSGGRYLGGLIGYDGAPSGSLAATYWDLDKGIGDPNRGAGNIDNDPGITGLSSAQFQSGLPNGFDPKVWGSDSRINKGYPYLLANPPR